MRHRSRTNSRHEENRELLAEYREANPWCEFPPSICGRKHDATELHHISQGGVRYDLLSNIIHLCGEAHRWCHANPVDGKLICLGVKSGKGELFEHEFNTASVRNLEWYVDCAEPVHPAAVAAQQSMKGT